MSASSASRTSLPENGASTRVNNGDASGRTQLSLFDVPVGDEAQWEKARRLIADGIDEIGLKDVCFDVGMTKSNLEHCLAGRDRHHIPARVLVYVLAHAKTDDLLRFLAALRGRDVVVPEILTTEEELVRTKQAVAKLFGPGGSDLVRKDVYGR